MPLLGESIEDDRRQHRESGIHDFWMFCDLWRGEQFFTILGNFAFPVILELFNAIYLVRSATICFLALAFVAFNRAT